MATKDASKTASFTNAQSSGSKPKRVRTGCLTCRQRHLKCDEALPNCLNCRKSGRECKRGIRLNFIDTQVQTPPPIPESGPWNVDFVDESRDIAAEYQDGLSLYAAHVPDPNTAAVGSLDPPLDFDYPDNMPAAPAMAHQDLPTNHSMMPGQDMQQSQATNFFDQAQDHSPHNMSNSVSAEQSYAQSAMAVQQTSYDATGQQIPSSPDTDTNDTREILINQEETLYMQIFIEEVAAWMDSMDPKKHFSRIMPFHALGSPMLLNAFFACGVRHLTLVNPAVFNEEKAIKYYDVASKHLLRALQNPQRNSVICATTAVILNVYEIMTEKAMPRMNHIAGSRALIKECGWDARSTGIGAACFWLNVGLETLSNLRFNWQSSWSPDEWGMQLDLSQETSTGNEESWTLKILYIIAKISDFRATIPGKKDVSPQGEQLRRQKRWEEWSHLKDLADTWNSNIPRTMQPLAYLYPNQKNSESLFPEIYLIKRTTIIARLFYHTAMLLLAQISPARQEDMANMRSMEDIHAHQICGIVAHVKDRGVASVALRCLVHAAEVLTDRREQEEVLRVFSNIHHQTGWRIGFIPLELQEKWGWTQQPTDQNSPFNFAHSSDASSVHSNPNTFNVVSPGMQGSHGIQGASQDQHHLARAMAMAAASAGASPHNAQAPSNANAVNGTPSMSGAGMSNMSPMSTTLSPTSPHFKRSFDQYASVAESRKAAQLQRQQRQHQHHQQQQQQQQQQQAQYNQTYSMTVSPPVSRGQPPPQGIVNPMFARADFSHTQHPYQDHWVPPSNHHGQSGGLAPGGLGLGIGGLYGPSYGWTG